MSSALNISKNLIVFVLIAALLFATVFIVHEADHHCSGEDCPICRIIKNCIALLNDISLAILFLIFVSFISNTLYLIPCKIEIPFKNLNLISLKIKFSC